MSLAELYASCPAWVNLIPLVEGQGVDSIEDCVIQCLVAQIIEEDPKKDVRYLVFVQSDSHGFIRRLKNGLIIAIGGVREANPTSVSVFGSTVSCLSTNDAMRLGGHGANIIIQAYPKQEMDEIDYAAVIPMLGVNNTRAMYFVAPVVRTVDESDEKHQ